MPAHIIEALRPFEVPIESVKELPGNPRRGSVKAVAESLQRFGQRKPIAVRKADGSILAGNHTWQAAKSLGWGSIAAVLVNVDEQTALAYSLADNRTSDLGGYDDALLATLIQSLREPFVGTGYEQRDLDRLLDRLDNSTPPTEEGDEAAELVCPKCGAAA